MPVYTPKYDLGCQFSENQRSDLYFFRIVGGKKPVGEQVCEARVKKMSIGGRLEALKPCLEFLRGGGQGGGDC